MTMPDSAYIPPLRLRREVYDFELAQNLQHLRVIIRDINREGWLIAGVAPYKDGILVIFRRPAHG